MKILVLTLFCIITICAAEIYFSEEFSDGWETRWVKSEHKGNEAGEWGISAGKFYNDQEADKGLQTKQDARFYQISAEMKEFSNRGKTLVVQFSVKHEQDIDCGGGYFKIIPSGLDQLNFQGDSQYNIMFGPDICGTSKRTHLIFNYKGKNYLIKDEISCESDEYTHLYTLILNPDQTFKVLIDNKEEKSGTLPTGWDFLPPKEILDPNVSKPKDWVDQKEISDPSAEKPESWDDIPKQVKDPEAVKPNDWDQELDGEWEAPLIDNPDYKGEWKAPMIKNPAYKGEWVHPKIANPDYKEDAEIYVYENNKYIGIEIWQVKSGTIFDNILVTDDVEIAKQWAEKTLKEKEGEKRMHDKFEEENKLTEKPDDVSSEDDLEAEELDEEDTPPHVHDEL